MQTTTFTRLETMFLALGDKTRLRLLALMADGPVAVGFLADRLKESQPKVSRHLAYLRNAGMVTTSRDGKWVYYGIRYPNDLTQRRILDVLISSIAVMRVDGRDVFIAESESTDESKSNTYDKAYRIGNDEPAIESYGEGIRTDEADLDVFLL